MTDERHFLDCAVWPHNGGTGLSQECTCGAVPAAPDSGDDRIERACEVMHDAYEAAAVTAGWETQERSRKPWSDVPEANKVTMRAAVAALLASPLLSEYGAEQREQGRRDVYDLIGPQHADEVRFLLGEEATP